MGMLRGARTASGAVAHSFRGNPTWHVLYDDEFHSCDNVATISQTINASGPPQIVTAPHLRRGAVVRFLRFAGGYATNSCSGCFTVRTGQGDSRTTFSALEPKTRWLAPRRPCVANTIRSTLSFSASRTI